MFDIGDKVWVAHWDKDKRWETCPHCLGKKYLTIIMGDESQVSIDCICCTDQWKSPGKIPIYDYLPKAEEITIDGYEVSKDHGARKIHYRSGCHGYDNAFATKEEALDFALAKIEQQKAEDERTLNCTKEKAEKSWSHNAAYHLEQIANFEKQLEYHRTKLDVAELRIKGGRK